MSVTAITKRLSLMVVALAMAISASIVINTKDAQAGSCHSFNYYAALSSGEYTYTDVFTVPSWSACRDINVVGLANWNGDNICSDIRVRFYPSSGGSYTNAWKWHCSGTHTIAASNVANGTKYRLEVEVNMAVMGWMYD